MAACSNCLRGECRKHPLLDHGRRVRELQAKAQLIGSADTSGQQSIISLVSQRIISHRDAIKRAKDDEADEAEYRLQLEADRLALMSKTHETNEKKRKRSDLLRQTGLNPAVVATLVDSESDEESDSDSDSESDAKSKESSQGLNAETDKKARMKGKEKERGKSKKKDKVKRKKKKKQKK